MFQCSSASRKFLNQPYRRAAVEVEEFQCSSASRKFLNSHVYGSLNDGYSPFQCSSASRKFLNTKYLRRCITPLSFQCSSASRKFLNDEDVLALLNSDEVSVLFSEPKIPQSSPSPAPSIDCTRCFSALQRAENSSMLGSCFGAPGACSFQCSSASRKFLN